MLVPVLVIVAVAVMLMAVGPAAAAAAVVVVAAAAAAVVTRQTRTALRTLPHRLPLTANIATPPLQVLGDIYMAHDIGPDDVVIVGKDGVLLAGPNALILEPLVSSS